MARLIGHRAIAELRRKLAGVGCCGAVLAATAVSVGLQAHHASSSIDLRTPIWVTGTVVRFDRINPHTIIELDEVVDGQPRRWRIEGPFVARLKRMEADERLPEAGDTIEVCGFASKHAVPDAQPFIHGRVLVLDDGRLRSWGPYGRIDNCVRPDDDRRRWLELLESDSAAKEGWCDKERAAVPTRAESRPLVDEIGRLLTPPCS
jgi:hypothetical protein